MKITIPNIITTIRLAAIPFMAYYIYAGSNINSKYDIVAFILFAAIWATDIVDGYIARNFNQVSDFGKIYDPVVDKLFQFVTAVMLTVIGKIPVWIPIVMFIKDILMLIGSTVLVKKYNKVIASKWYGKLATVMFFICFVIMFFIPTGSGFNSGLMFLIPVVISFVAYFQYFRITLFRFWCKKEEL